MFNEKFIFIIILYSYGKKSNRLRPCIKNPKFNEIKAMKEDDIIKQILAAKQAGYLLKSNNVLDYSELCELLNHDITLNDKLCSAEYYKVLSEGVEKIDLEQKELNILKLIDIYEGKQKNRLRYKIIFSIVAALIAITALVYTKKYNEDPQELLVENIKDNLQYPTIIYYDGEIEELNTKNDSYNVNAKEIKNELTNVVNKNSSNKNNKIIVPKSMTQKLILDDGTEVLLNSGSVLEFPSKFDSGSREVKASGEIFFKVAKDSRLFIVNANELSIKVYGTEFNVSTSPENRSEVLLLKGSVGVMVNGEETKLKPSEILSFNAHDGNVDVKRVEIYNYMWWQDTNFRQKDGSLSKLIEIIENWYDVEIINNLKKDKIITISISKEIELNKLLNIIEESYDVRIKRKGGNYYSIEDL